MKVFCRKRNRPVDYTVCCNCELYDTCPERRDAGAVRMIGISAIAMMVTSLIIIYIFS